jgi:hypothetical protein
MMAQINMKKHRPITNQPSALGTIRRTYWGRAIWGWYTPNIWATTPTWVALNNGAPVVSTDAVGLTPATTTPIASGGGCSIAPQKLGTSIQGSEYVLVEHVGKMIQADLSSAPAKVYNMSTYIAAAANTIGKSRPNRANRA